MIDVLLPFRGDRAMLHAAVRSVLAQDDPDWRLHVVDDADPDTDATTWITGLRDARVSVTRLPGRHGVNAVFRTCAALASADLVTVMGCDDVMHPDHLRTCRDLAARHPDAAVVQPGVRVVGADGRPVRTATDLVKAALRPRSEDVLSGSRLARSLLVGNWTYFPSLVWRRRVLVAPGFRPGLETTLDLQLLLDLAFSGDGLVVGDRTTFDYRRHRGSASSVTARSADRFAETDRVHAEAAARCEALGWHGAARAARWRPTARLHAAVTAATVSRAGDTRVSGRLLRSAVGR